MRDFKNVDYEFEIIKSGNDNDQVNFKKRLNAILKELGEIQSKLHYLKYYYKEIESKNNIFNKAPQFMEWTRIASWHEIFIRLSKLLEVRKKGDNLKNIRTLHNFVSNVQESLFNKIFYRIVYDNKSDDKDKTKVDTHSWRAIDNSYKGYFVKNNKLIKTIMNYRDNKLAHLTFKKLDIRISIEDIFILLKETQDLLNMYSLKFDNTVHVITHYSYEDFKEIFNKFNS